MKGITANLKLLYQTREMWGWYFLFFISILHILSSFFTPQSRHITDLSYNWDLIAPLLPLAVWGCAMGRLAASIWTKPISFCMPGHIRTSRKMLTLMGIAVASVTSLIMMIFPFWLTLKPLNIVTLFSFYLLIYCLSVITSILFNKLVFVIPYLVLFVMPLMNRLEMLSLIQNILLNDTWSSLFVCWAVILLIYYVVGTKYLPRRMCGAPSMTFFVGSEAPGSDLYSTPLPQNNPLPKRIAGAVNQFFLVRIQYNKSSSIVPHIWGRIYVILGSFISNWRVIFFDGPIIFLAAAIFINSIRVIDLQSFLYSFIGLLGGHICVMSGSDIFLPVDRRGRFFSELTALMTAISIMLIITGLFAFLSRILPHSVTSFINLTWSSNFVTLHVKYIFITMILLPITGGLLILFRKKSFLFILTVTGIAIFLLGAHYHMIKKIGFAFSAFNIPSIVLLTALSFGFYMAIIYYSVIKRSLFLRN